MANLSKGSYSGLASGYQTTFEVDWIMYIGQFERGVRGINIPDIVTVLDNGVVFSSKLGSCTEYVKAQICKRNLILILELKPRIISFIN